FDLSPARGLDYYTGVIYEAVLSQTGVAPVATESSNGALRSVSQWAVWLVGEIRWLGGHG
ncbi:unnamed protein product, partial [Tetraodon nigroviridis]